ncbi:MAG: hemerythrin domain-containing protein [Candidatus Binatia bacterium]
MENEANLAKATEALKQDHRIIERVLAVLERLSKRPAEVPVTTWEKVLDFIRNFADKCHHLKEERIFFPALEEHGIPREGGPIGMMLTEHEEARGYVRAMGAALTQGGGASPSSTGDLVGNAKAYLRLLRQHIEKEDEVLFSMADDALTLDEQKQLLREFEEHEEAEIGKGVHAKYLKIADELESDNL